MGDLRVPWEIIKRQGRQEVDSKQDSKVGVIKRRYPDNKYDVAVENIGTAGTCLLRISTAKPEDVYNVGDSVIIDFPQGKIAYAQIRGRSNITIPEEEEYIFGVVQDWIYLTANGAYYLAIYNTDGDAGSPPSFTIESSTGRATTTDDSYFYIADTNGLYKYDVATGLKIWKVSQNGTSPGQFKGPRDIIHLNNFLFITDTTRNKIIKYNTSGSYITEWGSTGTGDGQFDGIWGIDYNSAGYIFVADRNNLRIQKFNTSGTFIAKYTTGNPKCYGLAIDSSDNIFVTNYTGSSVLKYNSSGVYQSSFSCGCTLAYSLEIDADGNIYVGNGNNNRVQKYNSAGVFIKQWNTSSPGGLLFVSA